MCVGVPAKILSTHGLMAMAESYLGQEELDLALIGPQSEGTWVLSFLGTARAVIDAEEAAKIEAAILAIKRAEQGLDIGDAFADITAAPPQLPPHLQAEFEAQEMRKSQQKEA